MTDDKDKREVWRAPTRRVFVAMLGAAAAAFALPGKVSTEEPQEPPRTTRTGKTRWIGHC